MNFKEFLKAMQTIEDDRKITKEIVIAALQEALAKAYRKHIDIPDVLVRVDINEANGQIHVYQQYTVVEEVEDEELEIALAEVKDKGYQLGDLVDREVDISQIGRAAALLAKNVMKQKIREAEKQAVYDEYIDQLDEMVTGMIESVEEKFCRRQSGKDDGADAARRSDPGRTLRRRSEHPCRHHRMSTRIPRVRRCWFPVPTRSWSSVCLKRKFRKSIRVSSRSRRLPVKPGNGRRWPSGRTTRTSMRSAPASVRAAAAFRSSSTS